MFGTLAFTYGLLMSFVLSGGSRNLRLQRAHPPTMLYIGYLLLGVTLGGMIALALHLLGVVSLF